MPFFMYHFPITIHHRLVLTQAVYHFKDYFLTQQFRL